MTDQPTRALPATPTELQDGRFVTGEVLGTGGMAIVVRAEDTLLGRNVAVKLLADALAFDPEARERFSREARAMAGLNHPNVVQVYDVGEFDERPYFIMEHVAGGSLAERLRRDGALPPEEVDRVAVEALRGLAHAHAAGLLHRDVKPANLLVATDGTVKVTDFGVARAAESQTLTRTGIVLGTMRYLAPERLRGQGSTEASDLYGLGATLYELVTAAGIDPKKDAEPLRRLPESTPPTLRAFLEATLAEDPRQRPASAEEALALWDVERTRALPEVADVGATRRVEPDAPTEAHPTATPEGYDIAPGPSREGSWWEGLTPAARRWLVGGLVTIALLLALTAVSQPTTPEGGPGTDAAPTQGADQPAEGAEQPAESAEQPAGDAGTAGGGAIPAGDTPLDTARNTAAWLRDLGG